MTHYIALAVDAAPTYAVYLPLVVRIWKRLGYQPLIFLHADRDGWAGTAFGQAVMDTLHDDGCTWRTIHTCEPMSIANTMRCVRLVAASDANLHPNDFVLTADVDMIPLSRSFFDVVGEIVVLRGLGDLWVRQSILKPPVPPNPMIAGEVRFPMCYSGARVRRWRSMLPIVVGDSYTSLLRTIAPYLEGRTEHTDLDETIVSRAILSQPDVAGARQVAFGHGAWTQGALTLIDPREPKLTPHEHMHRGMLIGSQGWIPGRGEPPKDAIDFIPDRFYAGHRPWWCFDVAKAYFPEEAEWISGFVERMKKVLG